MFFLFNEDSCVSYRMINKYSVLADHSAIYHSLFQERRIRVTGYVSIFLGLAMWKLILCKNSLNMMIMGGLRFATSGEQKNRSLNGKPHLDPLDAGAPNLEIYTHVGPCSYHELGVFMRCFSFATCWNHAGDSPSSILYYSTTQYRRCWNQRLRYPSCFQNIHSACAQTYLTHKHLIPVFR